MTRLQGLFVIPSCEETARLISLGLDRKLSLRQRYQLRAHLKLCINCRGFHDQAGLMHKTFDALFHRNGSSPDIPFTALSDESKTRIKKELQAHNR